MPAFVRTRRDEDLWSKAKARAKEQGRAEDWPYVTGIFKRMKGGKVAAYLALLREARDILGLEDDDRTAGTYEQYVYRKKERGETPLPREQWDARQRKPKPKRREPTLEERWKREQARRMRPRTVEGAAARVAARHLAKRS